MDLENFWRMLKSGKIVIYIQQMTVQVQPEKPRPPSDEDCEPMKCNEVVCGLFGECKKIVSQSDEF